MRWVGSVKIKIFNMIKDYENIEHNEKVRTVKSWKYWELRYYRD